jgi:hypothetical protein
VQRVIAAGSRSVLDWFVRRVKRLQFRACEDAVHALPTRPLEDIGHGERPIGRDTPQAVELAAVF